MCFIPLMKFKVNFFISILFLTSICFANNRPNKIVFIGDSLTEGYGVPTEKAFPKLIENQLKTKYKNISVINAGSSGSTAASAVKRVKWLIKSKPTIIFIALGANDGLRGLDLKQTEKNLQDSITLALEKKIKVVLAGVRLPLNYGKTYRVQFEDLYKKLAKNNSITFIPYLLKGVGGVKKLNQPDQIHPNEAGHQEIFKTVLPYIEKLL